MDEDESLLLATPPSASIRAGPTPSPKTDQLLRATTAMRKPRCTDFGTARRFAFQGQGYFFCSSCDLWDALPADTNKKVSMDSLMFGCKANHKYFSHPTALRNEDCYIRRKRTAVLAPAPSSTHVCPTIVVDNMLLDDAIESEESNCSSSATTPTRSSDVLRNGCHDNDVDEISTSTNNNQPLMDDGSGVADNFIIPGSVTCSDPDDTRSPLLLRALVEQLKGKLALLKERNRRLLIENKKLRNDARLKERNDTSSRSNNNHHASTSSRNELFTKDVLEAVNGVLGRYRRWGDNRVGQLVAKVVWSQDKFLPHLLRKARKHFRDNIFTPYNILREMDLAGGTLSYEGIDILRRVETGGVKRFRGSMIPSKSELKRMAGAVEWYAREQCPFQSQQTSTGESVEFNYPKSMMCIAQAFHLDEIGKSRSLSVASSIDGASLSKNLSIIAGGIKVTDRAARCPITNRPLLDNPTTMSAQSRNLCIPLKIMMGRETKETFTEFGSLFKFVDDIADEATLPTEMTGFIPFTCMTNCDLSAQWKGLCKGGAAKVHTLPCPGCATESDYLATPNASPCTRWCMDHSTDPDWMCFHSKWQPRES
ncbi:hypothetical protein MHU86_16985 [Fragilaria crotonensis]|nr:hypothetical protein MHU86_16985 [Fragilaria crotonensis]